MKILTNTGITATLTGLTILITLAIYYAFVGLFFSKDVALIYKIAIPLVVLGVITIFIGIIRENIKSKSDNKLNAVEN